MLFGQMVFGGLGCQGPETTHVQEKSGFLALPPSAAKLKNHSFLESVWFLGLGTPGVPKTTWPKNLFGIPLRHTRDPGGARDLAGPPRPQVCLTCVFWTRPGNGHGISLKLISGANCKCVLHHVSSLSRWSGSRGQAWPGNDRKGQNLDYKFCFLA